MEVAVFEKSDGPVLVVENEEVFGLSITLIRKDEQIFMLYAYPKSKKDDLSADQIRQLKSLVEEKLS